jgi:hypothetical protein
LQLRNLQSLVEIGVDQNTTVVFPAPLMSTIQELGAFLAREQAAGTTPAPAPTTPDRSTSPASPATSTGPAIEPPATEQASTPATTEHPPPSSLRADQAAGRLGRTSGAEGSRTQAAGSAAVSRHPELNR